MSSNTHGFSNEKEIVAYLNKAKIFANLNINMKNFISFMFHNIESSDVIFAQVISGVSKPDMYIEVNGIRKYISIKKGSGNSIHQEKLDVFEKFLTNENIEQKYINYLKEFHFGDGTVNGTGKARICSRKFCALYPEKIVEINKEFNKPEILKKLLNRIIFIGNIEGNEVDYVYHGEINKGIWASREEIEEYLLNNQISDNCIHFSSLTYQVWNRGLNFNPNTAARRYVMQIKWGSLVDDLVKIREKNG